jgi:hypothetical protein
MSARRFLAKLSVLTALLIPALARPLAAETNDHVVSSEAPIVNRNALQAEQRALADAFRQATERAFQDLLKEVGAEGQALSPGLAQLKASLASKGQRFVRGYRVLEKDESNGILRLQIDADVNTALLRREIEKTRGAIAPEPTGAATAPTSVGAVLMGGDLPEDVRSATATVLGSSGARVQATPIREEGALVAAAIKQNGQALWITSTWFGEGLVRGTTQVSERCELRARLLPQGPVGRPALIDRTLSERGFASDQAAARLTCAKAAATTLARQMADLLRPVPAASRYVSMDLDVVEPAALMTVVQTLKRLGAVNAVEVRRVSPRQAEIRIFTRMSGREIQSGLTRDLAGRVSLTEVKPPTDRLTLQARLRQAGEPQPAAGAEPPASTP